MDRLHFRVDLRHSTIPILKVDGDEDEDEGAGESVDGEDGGEGEGGKRVYHSLPERVSEASVHRRTCHLASSDS